MASAKEKTAQNAWCRRRHSGSASAQALVFAHRMRVGRRLAPETELQAESLLEPVVGEGLLVERGHLNPPGGAVQRERLG